MIQFYFLIVYFSEREKKKKKKQKKNTLFLTNQSKVTRIDFIAVRQQANGNKEDFLKYFNAQS